MFLNGWKEISNYLGRGVRTVQRWEHLGLPVRRPAGRTRSAVCALPDEIDAWVKRMGSGRLSEDGDQGAMEADFSSTSEQPTNSSLKNADVKQLRRTG